MRRGSRNRGVPTRYGTTYTHKSEKIDLFESKTNREAVESSDKELWLVAMQQEMNAFAENETCSLVERPKDKIVMNGKWVFKVKQNEEGEIDKYKARYVAKGYARVEGVDFNETFAPPCRLETFRTVLAIAASRKISIEQMDIKSAYLHSEIQEEIYLEQPEGFEKENNLVCKLRKSIYGLRQAARNWYKKLHDFLLEKVMTKSANDPCLFTRKSQDIFLYILTWVDDIMRVGNKPEEVQKLKYSLSQNFKMKDRGKIKHFLGLRISQHEDGINVHQELFIQNVLRRFGMEDCKPIKTPVEMNLKLDKSSEQSDIDVTSYRSLVGSLLYVSKQTRPDVNWVTNQLSRHMQSPTQQPWVAAKRVLRYLQFTKTMKIVYDGNCDHLILQGASDADWSGDASDRKSTTGFYYKLSDSGGAISRNCKKQNTVALSSCEAEYQGMCAAVQEAIFLRQLLEDLFIPQMKPTKIAEDNQSCIKLCNNPVFHEKSKHMSTKLHYIREKVEDGSVEIFYQPTEKMVADIFTKALGKLKHEKHRNYLLGEHLLKDADLSYGEKLPGKV